MRSDSRYFWMSRVRAPSYEEAIRAFREVAERQGYAVIRVSCHPIHIPGGWEGVVEITDPEREGCQVESPDTAKTTSGDGASTCGIPGRW